MILHDSPVLRILTTVRDQMHQLRGLVPIGNVATGEGFADALDILDDAIVDELRVVRAQEAAPDEPAPAPPP